MDYVWAADDYCYKSLISLKGWTWSECGCSRCLTKKGLRRIEFFDHMGRQVVRIVKVGGKQEHVIKEYSFKPELSSEGRCTPPGEAPPSKP